MLERDLKLAVVGLKTTTPQAAPSITNAHQCPKPLTRVVVLLRRHAAPAAPASAAVCRRRPLLPPAAADQLNVPAGGAC